MDVRPKKHLGQHFLRNPHICERIASSLTGFGGYQQILEIGPGTGALTQFLLKLPYTTTVCEIDTESIAWLETHYPELRERILREDFLRLNIGARFQGPLAVIGNFPYNISSQILFHVLDHKEQIPELVGMFQREVARRVAEGPGSKEYGILSVLIQAWYDVEYLFTVDEHEFNPPPKVKSGVIRMQRKPQANLGCEESLFRAVVKTGFNQRRKTLRNSLRSMIRNESIISDPVFTRRPEQLDLAEFIRLTNLIAGQD